MLAETTAALAVARFVTLFAVIDGQRRIGIWAPRSPEIDLPQAWHRKPIMDVVDTVYRSSSGVSTLSADRGRVGGRPADMESLKRMLKRRSWPSASKPLGKSHIHSDSSPRACENFVHQGLGVGTFVLFPARASPVHFL